MNVRTLFYRAPATAAITALCVLVFAVTAAQSRSLNDLVWGSSLGVRMVLYGPFVTEEPLGWLRLITAGFLHLDATHLFVNMLMLVLIGGEVERFVGTPRFVAAWLIGSAASSGAVLAMNFDIATAGASGALFTLLVVLVAIAYRRSADLRAPVFLLVLNVAYTFVVPGVSVWGHLGGLAAGVVLAWPLTCAPVIPRRRPR
ncbi:Membrane associated serine protease, rhomboid family [Corynebacterium mycetoides]|uniref:Membrane associated serine protease, rhomboid family n=1 Tax=Corynebacterium mycetoides TaxID=38302 RepID=A0A1G9PWK7_9CORY|nr:rhomboid family intramembrane serine protease [Corynebacterium mycetoides]SDM03124.1 Membrane associated serine protease, rhomboid family [Corynebacterium mycetoides]